MSLAGMLRQLQSSFEGRVEEGVALARATTYRVGGPADLFVEPASLDDVRRLSEALRAQPTPVPVLPLGRGSNVVVSDAGFPGVVMRLGSAFSWVRTWDPEGDAPGLIAGSATALPQVANWAARRAMGGAEWMIAIPGSIGGAVRMNAGAHGGDMSLILNRASIFDLVAGIVQERSRDQLGYAYRRSDLKEHEVVLDARLVLSADEESSVRRRMEGFRDHRARTQPGAVQNAGSVFKNPPGDSAGRLVEAAGLKGFRVGGARVSELHANFFIADDGASAQDVRDLVALVGARVREETGISLEPEIRFVGAFEETVAGGAR